jgi:hypothetical protein
VFCNSATVIWVSNFTYISIFIECIRARDFVCNRGGRKTDEIDSRIQMPPVGRGDGGGVV